MRTVTKHYIGGELVESHGREALGIEAYLEPRSLFPIAPGR